MTLPNLHAQVQAYDFDSGVFGLDFMDAALAFWQDASTAPVPTHLAYIYFNHTLSGSPVDLCASWLDAFNQ